MGWVVTRRAPRMSDRSFFSAELRDTLVVKGSILDCATVGQVFYALVAERDDATGRARKPSMFVIAFRRWRGPHNFAYKVLDESMGPTAARCPRRLLEQLEAARPVPPNDLAAAWRERCWKAVWKRERAARFAVRGTVVHFLRPISFSDGSSHDKLVFLERSTFRAPDGATRYQVPGWRDGEWSFEPFSHAQAEP